MFHIICHQGNINFKNEIALSIYSIQFSSVQWLSHVWLFATPWITAHQASLSITNSQSLLKLMSWWCHPAISVAVVPFSSCPQSLPASGSFPISQLFAWGGQSTGVQASASVLPTNTQDWSPLAWTGWISLQSKGLSMAQNPKHWHNQMLNKMWSNRNSLLLLGMQNGTDTLKDSLVVFHKTKHTLTIWLNKYTFWYLSKRFGNLSPCKNLLLNVPRHFIHNYQNLEATKMSNSRWMGNMWYIQTMKYFLVLKTNMAF